ncbi:MAG: DUF2155 domain-containing protein [Rickettsiales bacterium]|jgi:hypothetical protein
MRSCLLFALLAILSAPVLAVDENYIVDIPDSEPLEDEISPALDNELNPEHKLQKRVVDETKERKNFVYESAKNNVVILQALNKVVGRVSTFEAPMGIVSHFENLEIIAKKCWKAPPDEQPENSVLLEIREIKAGEIAKQIFRGWMMSSSPGLSALEHPVYDITVLSCEYRENLESN